MRVGNTNSNPAASTEVSKGRNAAKAGASERATAGIAADSAGASDAVRADFSTKGKDFALAKTAAENAPDVREEKLAELKRRIEAGSYKVDSHAIADKLVDEHIKTADLG